MESANVCSSRSLLVPDHVPKTFVQIFGKDSYLYIYRVSQKKFLIEVDVSVSHNR